MTIILRWFKITIKPNICARKYAKTNDVSINCAYDRARVLYTNVCS